MIEYIVIATPNELKLAQKYIQDYGFSPNTRIIITGVGGVNIYRALKDIPRESAHIINIGYAGSPNYKIWEWVRIGESKLYHPDVNILEPTLLLSVDDKLPCCYTSSNFVSGKAPDGVYDMELAFIVAMGFEVESLKVISDNMSYDEYLANT